MNKNDIMSLTAYGGRNKWNINKEGIYKVVTCSIKVIQIELIYIGSY